MGDARVRTRTWIMLSAAIGATLVPFGDGHYAWPRLTTVIVIWAAIVSYRGRPIVAAVPAFTLTAWPVVVHGDAYPLCCTYAGRIEAIVLSVATLVAVLAVRPTERRRPTIPADLIAIAAGLAILSQAALVAIDGRIGVDIIGWGVAAIALGLGMGSGVRPWILAVLPVVAFVGLVEAVGRSDGFLLAIVLAASITGPAERLFERRAQASASTTS